MVVNNVKDCYRLAQTTKNNPKAIGLFVAGGKAIDEKVAIANKQIVGPMQTSVNKGNRLVNYFSSLFK